MGKVFEIDCGRPSVMILPVKCLSQYQKMDMNELDEEKLRRAFQLEGTACANPCGKREHDNF